MRWILPLAPLVVVAACTAIPGLPGNNPNPGVLSASPSPGASHHVDAPSLDHLDRSAFLPGTHVTIFGAGFATDSAGNTIHFAGADAHPEVVTASQLVVTVPAGARSGEVSVEVGGQTSFSLPYVTEAPELATVSAGAASPGTTISVSGRYFSPSLAENQIGFNGRWVQPTSGTVSGGLTTLRVVVPDDVPLATQGTDPTIAVKTAVGTSGTLVFLAIPPLSGTNGQ